MAEKPTHKRRTLLHYMRITAACFCLVLCFAFVALWVQSYVSQGIFNWFPSKSIFVYATSWEGTARLGVTVHVDPDSLLKFDLGDSTRLPVGDYTAVFIPKRKLSPRSRTLQKPGFVGFNMDIAWSALTGKRELMNDGQVKPFTRTSKLSVPYWFLVLLTGTLAILLKPKPRLRFSLRVLLLLTTIAAVVLGAVAAITRVDKLM